MGCAASSTAPPDGIVGPVHAQSRAVRSKKMERKSSSLLQDRRMLAIEDPVLRDVCEQLQELQREAQQHRQQPTVSGPSRLAGCLRNQIKKYGEYHFSNWMLGNNDMQLPVQPDAQLRKRVRIMYDVGAADALLESAHVFVEQSSPLCNGSGPFGTNIMEVLLTCLAAMCVDESNVESVVEAGGWEVATQVAVTPSTFGEEAVRSALHLIYTMSRSENQGTEACFLRAHDRGTLSQAIQAVSHVFLNTQDPESVSLSGSILEELCKQPLGRGAITLSVGHGWIHDRAQHADDPYPFLQVMTSPSSKQLVPVAIQLIKGKLSHISVLVERTLTTPEHGSASSFDLLEPDTAADLINPLASLTELITLLAYTLWVPEVLESIKHEISEGNIDSLIAIATSGRSHLVEPAMQVLLHMSKSRVATKYMQDRLEVLWMTMKDTAHRQWAQWLLFQVEGLETQFAASASSRLTPTTPMLGEDVWNVPHRGNHRAVVIHSAG